MVCHFTSSDAVVSLLVLMSITLSGAFVGTLPLSWSSSRPRPTLEVCPPPLLSASILVGAPLDGDTHGPLESFPGQEQSEDVAANFSEYDFVNMVQQAPRGTLGIEEIDLLREVMQILAEKSDGAQAVEKLLYRLLAEYQAALRAKDENQTRTQLLEPTRQDFLATLQAWKRSIGEADRRNTNTLPTAVGKVLQLYRTQQELHSKGIKSLQPSHEEVETVLSVVASGRERGMDREARSIFQDFQQKYHCEPTVTMYRHLIASIAKSRERGAANRAENLLKEAAERFPPRLDEGKAVGITIDSFNVILTAWAKSGLEYGPERAEKLLWYMEQLESRYGNPGIVRPSVSSFTSLIDAYAQTNEWDGVSQCERILNRMLDHYLEGEADVEPNVASWTIVISAWARLSKKNNKGAAARADRLLRRMEALHKDGRISFAPDAITYVTCLNAFAFSKTSDGPGKARAILDEMYERYLDGDDTMKPSAKSIRIVIDALVRSNNPICMEQAESALDHYEDLLESLGSPEDPQETLEHLRDVYKTMLAGWCKQGDAEQAQAYLLDMVERGMKPDCFCWDKVIEANTHASDDGALERTLQLWDLMLESTRNGDLVPNERVYTSLLRGLTKAKADNLAKRAYSLLQEMLQGYQAGNKELAPTVYTYNAILLACSEDSTSQLDAFKLALKVFNEIRKMSGGPDHVSFGNMLRCAKLLPEGGQKEALVRSTFQLCCEQGFVSSFVVRDLQNVATEALWRSILGCPEGDVVDPDWLPSEWSRTVIARQRKQ